MEFQKASKEQAKLRLAVFGPSGSGKTFTSLRLAAGLGGNVAVIDTERGSASKYADRFTFDVLELHGNQRNIAIYCEAIAAAQANGYNVLIIDSLTHAWHELLAEVDRIARAKYRHLVDAILGFDGHVIATMRTKTEWTTTTDKGKTRPVRVGLAPEQGKGIEYEFDILMELTPEHDANIIKDRTGKYQDKSIAMPGEELGQELAAWLKEGMAPRKRKKQAPAKTEKPQPAPKQSGNDKWMADWGAFANHAMQHIPGPDGTPYYNHQKHVLATLRLELGDENALFWKDGTALAVPEGYTAETLYAALVKHAEGKEAPAP